MFERSISEQDVLDVIASGEAIAEYRDEKPYPAYLLLGFRAERPLHVVIAVDAQSDACHVVTVYEPNPDLWNSDFKTRRTPR